MPPDFTGIRTDYQKDLLDWSNYLSLASGNAVQLSDSQLSEIAQQMESGSGPQSFKDFSKGIWDSGMIPASEKASMPWLGLGIAQDYQSGQTAWSGLLNQYSEAWHSMTGQWLNPVYNPDPKQPGFGTDDFAKVWQAATNNWSATQFSANYQANPAFQKANPWLAQGMTYEQYKQNLTVTAVTLPDAYRTMTGESATPGQLSEWQGKFLSPEQLKTELLNDENFKQAHPWLLHGMDSKAQADQYRLETGAQMKAAWFAATGQQAGDDMINQHLDKFQSASDFSNFLKTDQATLDTYGWLKYGLDFQAFKMQKQTLQGTFGHAMSDEQAIQQISQAHQQASGGTVTSQGASPKSTGESVGPVR